MSTTPVVSVIMIFLNAADFLQDAIESVLAQAYQHWELFLIDDGSTDVSTHIARQYATRYPGKITYLNHPEHRNRGKGASRNLGISQSRGEYIAFLDADDYWLPNKLEEQIAILHAHPEAGMLYGDTLYWFSWTENPEDVSKDFTPRLGVETNTLIIPPKLLPLYIRGKAAVPCTCSVLVKRAVIETVGGFDETCQGINNFYEDQAIYAKICLVSPVIAVNVCWDKYRQRSNAKKEDIATIIIQELSARKHFLNWLDKYMTRQGFENIEIQLAIRKELWLLQNLGRLPVSVKTQARIRWIQKWLLWLEECILPSRLQNWLWLHK